jgi:arginine utilization protein RocB
VTTDLSARARELALAFTAWPSVSGTGDEAAFALRLAEVLTGFDAVWIAPIPDDPVQRANVFALKRGRGRRTIVLTGHFDTVPIDDYGAQVDLALQPEALCAALVASLRNEGGNALALADLESGDFLPGRGLLDMKAGLAAGIAAIEAYAGEATLLFLAVSDEEVKSAGARAAVPQLHAAAIEHGLDIALVINLDAISDQGEGATGRVVTYGSIGKQLLFAHVVGRHAHAGYPQDGVNAAYIMAELVRAIELSPRLSDVTGDEVAGPPSTLCAKDLKQGYNVTTPAQAFCYWNTLQHRQSGEDVMAIARELAAAALAAVKERTGHHVDLKTYGEIASNGQPVDVTLSLPDQTLAAMQAVVAQQKIDRPTVILGFASIPYPAVTLRDAALRAGIAQAVAPHGLGAVNYFAGISDMSYYGEASGDLSFVAANTPVWGTGFTLADPAGYPTINIGPWGRDYHTRLERLHAPYAFEVLPKVLLSVIEAVANRG